MIRTLILMALMMLSGYTADIANSEEMPSYKRSYFKHWQDVDKDCQNARHEVLVRESLGDVIMFKTENKCQVIKGLWFDYFTGTLIMNAQKIDVDHIVPLKNAWESGAWKWTPKRREAYANYLGNGWHLMVSYFSQNRSKGAKSPDQWLPENKEFHVMYCIAWCRIKVEWGLTATKAELKTLKEILKKEKNITYPELRF